MGLCVAHFAAAAERGFSKKSMASGKEPIVPAAVGFPSSTWRKIAIALKMAGAGILRRLLTTFSALAHNDCMKQHFIARDATVAELEQKAADAEQKATNESEPRATELRGRGETRIENGPHPRAVRGRWASLTGFVSVLARSRY
jgi:hypothetical protein